MKPDDDLTHKLWRLREGHRRADPAERVFFWFFLCVAGIIAYWLCKQLL